MRLPPALSRRLQSVTQRALNLVAGLPSFRFARSIRHVLLLVTGGLTLVIALLCARELQEDASRLLRVRALYEASLLGDRVFDATEHVAVERDLALSALHAREPEMIAALQELLEEARADTDARLDAAIGALAAKNFPELADVRGLIERGRAAIALMRPRIDDAATRPIDQRDAALTASWSEATTGLMTESETLWNAFIRRFADIDATVTLHLRLKHFLRTITDYTGRERSVIGQIISENADPTIEQTATLLRGDGTLAVSWQVSRLLAEQSGLYPAIASRFTDAESHFATMHDMSRSTFYVPGARIGAAYPIGPDLWFELSSQASDSLQALRTATRAATRAHLDGLMGDITRSILVNLAVLAVALLLCGHSFVLIGSRVVRPINEIIDALVLAMRGEPVSFTPKGRLGNEIGQLAQVLNVFQRNVEEIQRTAAELARSQGRLRAVVDYATDGLITIDTRGAVLSFNPSCERIFGYAAGEIVGRHVSVLAPELFPDGEGHDLASYVPDAEAQAKGRTAREVSARRRDGTTFPIDFSVSSFTLEDGVYYSAFVRDITERKAAEETLLGYTRALERSNRELDDFAYIASHDLKEPLRGLSNHSRFLLEDNAGKLDEDSAKRLHRLIHLSQRMEQLVNDLLYFSRLGRQELAFQTTDFTALVRDIEDTLEHFLAERNATIVATPALPTVVCDKTRITELCRNLIVNAIKYNDSEEKTVEVGFLASAPGPHGAAVKDVFYVKDNGRGIDPQFHKDVFRIFRRLQGGQEEGSGVGLTFAKKIVERHGGEIWLQSRLGEGATFFFTLGAPKTAADAGSKAA